MNFYKKYNDNYDWTKCILYLYIAVYKPLFFIHDYS